MNRHNLIFCIKSATFLFMYCTIHHRHRHLLPRLRHPPLPHRSHPKTLTQKEEKVQKIKKENIVLTS